VFRCLLEENGEFAAAQLLTRRPELARKSSECRGKLLGGVF
jgi:hypothetical protein